jgi:hypothetical protein
VALDGHDGGGSRSSVGPGVNSVNKFRTEFTSKTKLFCKYGFLVVLDLRNLI